VSYGAKRRDTHSVYGVRMNRDELEVELAREHPDAYAWAVRCTLGAREDAEDALHAAYEKILSGRAQFDGRSSFRTWLFGVVRLTALEQRRRRWLRLVRLQAWFAREPRVADDPPVESETCEQLRSALAQLSSRQHEMMHLVFYQELSVQEAADVLRIPLGTARTHYERGKARLRSLLTGMNRP
jgi:RNA polymerase sigma factor (sigma-70 family)